MTRLTTPGAMVGTMAYMSPEQVRGQALDVRTDLFSFGIVLYEMVSGVLPFGGNTAGMLAEAILNRVPVAPVRLNPQLPAKLEEIINKALEKDRKLRYQSAAEIRTDLQRVQRDSDSGRSALAARAVEPTDAPRFFGVPGAGAAPGALVVLLGVALSGWFLFSRKAHALNASDRSPSCKKRKGLWSKGPVRRLWICSPPCCSLEETKAQGVAGESSSYGKREGTQSIENTTRGPLNCSSKLEVSSLYRCFSVARVGKPGGWSFADRVIVFASK